MSWEKCRNFGVVKINPVNNIIHLYHDMHTSKSINPPGWNPVVESANWQGNNLMVRLVDNHGQRRSFIYRDFHDFQEIL